MAWHRKTFVIPGQARARGLLRQAHELKPDASSIPDHIRTLIEHELALIERLGYARYFLTVHDIVAFAR